MKSDASEVLSVVQVPIAEIQISATNARRSIDEVQLGELAQSIESVGIQVPLSLRRIAVIGPTKYEVVGGERRLRAAWIAKLETVPAIVRTMTDAECRDAGLIENLQRAEAAIAKAKAAAS